MTRWSGVCPHGRCRYLPTRCITTRGLVAGPKTPLTSYGHGPFVTPEASGFHPPVEGPELAPGHPRHAGNRSSTTLLGRLI
jgi:hypothetical protein